jgi:nitric oxide reductase large subunit
VFLFLLLVAFGVLLFGGHIMNRDKPPIPRTAIGAEGRTVYTGSDVMAGQKYFFSRGGQHMGTIWGHGSYLAPDWSADYLHRAALFLAARHLGKSPHEAESFSQADLERLDAPARGRVTALVDRTRGCPQPTRRQGGRGQERVSLAHLLPGFYQFYYAVRDGIWYARSPEITSGQAIRTFALLRIGPDLVLISGAVLLLAFVTRAIWLSRRRPV